MLFRIAFLGTGLMGYPMAARLLKAGHPVRAWNRTLSKAHPLEAQGAEIADTPAEAVAGAEVVCLMLENGAVVESVLFEQGVAAALVPGTIVIDFSSIAPWLAEDYARRLAEFGVHYVDAPVSGGPYGAEEGTLAIMVGGPSDAMEAVADVLAILGTATHVGPSGSGQVAKLGSQIIVASAISAVAEALLLATSAGADPARVRQALTGGFADSKILQIHAKRMLERDFEPGGHIRTHSKDLDAARTCAENARLDLPTTKFMHERFRELCDQGLGDYDHSALLLSLEAANEPVKLSKAKGSLALVGNGQSQGTAGAG